MDKVVYSFLISESNKRKDLKFLERVYVTIERKRIPAAYKCHLIR